MKKTTPQKLSNRLAKYSALSLAIAGVVDANGEIIHTPAVNIGGIGETIAIDIDNDGNREFFIRQKANYLSIAAFDSLSSYANSNPGSILGYDGNFGYPFALGSGYSISGGNAGTWMPEDTYFKVMNFENNCGNYSYYSYWCDVQDKFLGLRFYIGGNIHYGWARLDVEGNTNGGFGFILKDYAYESDPDTAIVTPDPATLGVKDNGFSNVKIVALNKSVALHNLPQQTNYRMFSISGQSVLNGKTDTNTYVIEANTLSSGIYIIELKNATTNAVMRKKIVL